MPSTSLASGTATSPERIFASRAAARLKKFLDEQGAPYDALGRVQFVAEHLRLQSQEANQILGGVVPWTWDQLHAVAQYCDRNPGYFLDERNTSLPSDVLVVPSVDGGETIVWRTPRGWLRRPLRTKSLSYITQHFANKTLPTGSLLIFEEVVAAEALEPGLSYVLMCNGGLESATCVEIKGSMASFTSAAGVGRVLEHPAPSNLPEDAARVIGRIAAAIKPLQ
jgi:hypothetical protein